MGSAVQVKVFKKGGLTNCQQLLIARRFKFMIRRGLDIMFWGAIERVELLQAVQELEGHKAGLLGGRDTSVHV